MKKTISLSEKSVNLLTWNPKRFVRGVKKVRLKLLQLLPTNSCIINKACCHLLTMFLLMRQYHQKKKTLYIVELVPKNNLTTYLDKLNLCNPNTLVTRLLQIVLQESISRGKVFKPFWNEQCQKLSEISWLPIKIDSVDSDLTSLKALSILEEEKSLSWITKTNLCQQNKNWLQTYYPLFTSITADKWEKEGIQNRELFKSLKIRLYPTQIQKQQIKGWMGTARYIYNKTLNHIQTTHENNWMKNRNQLITKESRFCEECKILSKSYTCKVCKSECSVLINQNIHDWELRTPKEIRLYALKSVSSAYKSAWTNVKRGHFSGFNMKFKSKKKTNVQDCIEIVKTAVNFKNNKVFIYPTILKSGIKIGKRNLKKYKDMKLIDHCKLEFDGTFYNLIINSKVIVKKEHQQLDKVISIDPGVKTFLTCYDPDGNVTEFNKSDKIKQLKKKINNMSFLRKKKRYILKANLKIRNLIDELHWKSINFLTKNYNTVILPNFESQGIVKNSLKTSLNRETMLLRHYTFRERLKSKARTIKNMVIVSVTEEYTTKTCGYCGVLNKKIVLGDSEFTCGSCNLTFNRDYNGARNIFLKTITGQ
jgi:putative transposase